LQTLRTYPRSHEPQLASRAYAVARGKCSNTWWGQISPTSPGP
jgi:hypothetical protein